MVFSRSLPVGYTRSEGPHAATSSNARIRTLPITIGPIRGLPRSPEAPVSEIPFGHPGRHRYTPSAPPVAGGVLARAKAERPLMRRQPLTPGTAQIALRRVQIIAPPNASVQRA